MKYFWRDYWYKNLNFYYGELGYFQFGFHIGKDNCLYLGFWCIGVEICQ